MMITISLEHVLDYTTKVCHYVPVEVGYVKLGIGYGFLLALLD